MEGQRRLLRYELVGYPCHFVEMNSLQYSMRNVINWMVILCLTVEGENISYKCQINLSWLKTFL